MEQPSPGTTSALARRLSLRTRLWRHAKVLVVGDPWRLVLLLAVFPLVVGSIITYLSRSGGGLWLEIGTGLIGGSVIGLVFALVQHTLDNNSAQRQATEGVRFTVSSTTDLNGIDLRGADLQGSYMRSKVLSTARLDGSVLDRVDLRGAQLDAASLVGASLNGADLTDANLAGCNLHHAELSATIFTGAQLGGARLVDADLKGADLRMAPRIDPVTGRDSGPAVVSRACMDTADVSGTDLHGILGSFLTARGLDARDTDLRDADLSGADLRGASLSDARCAGADLTGADLRGAVLAGTDLSGARLVGARMEGADLQGATIAGADLSRAGLRGAHHIERLDLRIASEPDDVLREAADPSTSSPVRLDRVHLVDRTGAAAPFAEVVAVLRRRRARLGELKADDAAISRMELAPDWGHPEEHGLPTRIVRAAAFPRPDASVTLRIEGDALVVSADTNRGRATISVPSTSDPTTMATAVQLVLCEPGGFRTMAALEEIAALLDDPAPSLAVQRERVGRARAAEDHNDLLLCLSSWLAESSDAAEMEQAVDDALVAWCRTERRERRALLAARLSWAQCQLLHRADPDDATRLLERARAAGDVALDLLLSAMDPSSRPTRRQLALLSLASHAKSFSDHVTEERADLERGVERYRAMIADLEREGLDVSPTTRNNLGYCAMALAGRLTRGPSTELYEEAAGQFDQILESFGLLERPSARPSAGPTDRLGPLRVLAERGPDSEVPRDERLLARPVRLALANRGNLYRLHKQYDEAVVCYSAALHLEPRYLEAWAERAWVHAERPPTAGERDPHDDADADVQRLLDSDSGTTSQRAKTLRSVCWAFVRAGEPAHCERWLGELHALDPECQDLEALKDLVVTANGHGPDRSDRRETGNVNS